MFKGIQRILLSSSLALLVVSGLISCGGSSEDGLNERSVASMLEEELITSNSKYTVVLHNNTVQAADFTIFQTDQHTSEVYSLAWLTTHAFREEYAELSWRSEYSFYWSRNSHLAAGIILNPETFLNADPESLNMVNFTSNGGQASFVNQTISGAPGYLSIDSDNTIGFGNYAIGIAMDDKPVYATSALANFRTSFSANPRFWITVSRSYQLSEIISSDELSKSTEIVFPNGVTTLNVTLNQDYTFTISP